MWQWRVKENASEEAWWLVKVSPQDNFKCVLDIYIVFYGLKIRHKIFKWLDMKKKPFSKYWQGFIKINIYFNSK